MTDEPRDELDRVLGAGLGRLGGDSPDTDAALAELQPRFRRARTRTRVARASVVALVLVVAGSTAYAFSSSDSNASKVQVASSSTTSGGPKESTSTTPRRNTTSTVSPLTTPTSVERSGPQPTEVPVPNGGVNEPGPEATVPSPAPTTVGAGAVHAYSSDGGTLTVRFAAGRLSLVSYKASAGYTAELHTNKPDDIEVRFSRGERGGEDVRIRIRVENGQVVRVDD